MLRREFMKYITGGLTAVVVPTSTAVGRLASKEGYGTWVYRNLSDPHGNRSFWHPVFHAGGYWGNVGRNWEKFSDEMLTEKEWREFIRKYQIVRKVINSSEVVKDDELQEMEVGRLLNTLYRAAYYLRYHGVGDSLIHSAVREIHRKSYIKGLDISNGKQRNS